MVTVSIFILSYEKKVELSILESVLASGEITVITRNNAHCCYLYRGQGAGFEYDLARSFADFLGVSLSIKIADNWEAMIPALAETPSAFVAASMTITSKRLEQAAFSDGYMKIRQHIIVHRDNRKIKKLKDLTGKTIFVRRGTSYHEQLEKLKEKGMDFNIKAIANISTEELIRRVAEKRIEITIADSSIAQLNRRYYPKIIISGPINGEEVLGWAVNSDAKELLGKINEFFKEIRENGVLKEIYDRYYSNIDVFDYVDLRIFHRRLITRLPKYQPYIKKAADKYGFDWRLIAAQVYQESHYNRWAESRAGAFGLMQLTRPTAKSLGVKNIIDPPQNINAGVKHLKKLFDHYDKAMSPDRLLISLAAYNIGQGHILDARNLARKMNLDPNKWASMVKTLPLLQKRKYFRNAKYGFCRGKESLKYVKQIMLYYDILKHEGIRYNMDTSGQQDFSLLTRSM